MTYNNFALTPSTSGAQPTNLADHAAAYLDIMTDDFGRKYRVWFGFSVAEAEMAGDEASNLPFDPDHVVRIDLID